MFRTMIIFLFLSGCATTYSTEGQHYMGIKQLIAKAYYSQAIVEMFTFEEMYPQSQFLCEFYNFHVAYAIEHNLNSQKIKYEILYKKNCLEIKK